ncbi:MAG: NADH-quinone oxidoreductase subunit C [Solirubrobacterales bacterium]
MPDGPGLELIMAEVNRAHPGAVLDTGYDREQASLVVPAERVREVLEWLRDTPGQEYTFLSSLHAADYLPAEPRFAVHYELLNRERYERIRVKALLPGPASSFGAGSEANGSVARGTGNGSSSLVEGAEGAGPSTAIEEGDVEDSGGSPGDRLSEAFGRGGEEGSGGAPGEGRPTESPTTVAPEPPEIDSVVDLFPTADFQEREAYDFFGIVFRGHPDLRRMFMPEDYVGHPQRRDFPIGGEPVIFTRDEPADPGWWK